jgi:L-lactate dehydrogenase complex protein LldF
MQNRANNFIALSEIAVQDDNLRTAIVKGTNTAFYNRIKAMTAESAEHGEALRQQAAEAKRRALRKLPDLLEQAEAHMTENGIQVLWAQNGDEANQLVLDIARENQVKRITKSKSMMTEETALNDVLLDAGMDVIETDLGEYIIQLAEEHPSHIIAPVIHKSKASIRDLFKEKLDMAHTDDAQEMVHFAREILREAFLSADMGISGGNFVIAETGSLCLVMNEGNGRMVTSVPRIHVAMVGIEKVVETFEDYVTLTQILPRSGTGQAMTVYTNIINGVCDDGGPEQVYVIFVDNGRSEVYSKEAYTEALACIRCGACLNGCPVYRSTGGHAYGWVYGGPIGAVITPLLTGLENAQPLPHASSLCGTCKQVCPVNIDLPRMLLDLRHDLVEAGHTSFGWNTGIKMWERAMASPTLYDWASKAARLGLQVGAEKIVPNPLGTWQEHRDFPGFANKSFKQLWREQEKERESHG